MPPVEEEEPPPVEEEKGGGGAPNAASSWGDASVGKLIGGYHQLGYFPFPQGVIDMADIKHIGASASVTMFVKNDGTLWVAGNNSGVGTVGNGLADVDVMIPQHIAGGVPLYPAEADAYAETDAERKANEKNFTWHQPLGPVGPVLPPILATSGGPGTLALALTNDRRVLAWGNGAEGQLGNGYDTRPNPVTFEQAGQWPQYAPWWVQKAGPSLLAVKTAEEKNGGVVSSAQSKKLKEEAEAQALTGIIAIAAAEKCGYYLDEHGEVWITGQVAGDPTQHNFAEVDTLWAGRPGGTPKAIAITATRYGYVLLLEDKSLRYVGVPMKNTEEEKETGVRTISNPGLSNIVAVAKGEYVWIALRNDGKLFVCGSNVQGGLGLGRAENEPAFTPVELPLASLTMGAGVKVIAVAAGGVKIGNGSNNGDVFAVLLSDGTIRTWGQNYTVGTGAGIQYLPWGTLGDGTNEDRFSPVKPAIENVKAICANPTHMVVLQEPAEPAPHSLRMTVIGKTVQIDWVEVTGVAGERRVWRPPEGWQVKLLGPTKAKSPTLPGSARSWTSGILAPGVYEVRVVELSTTERPAITGGATKTGAGGKQTLSWAAPGKEEPSWIIEGRRVGEDWQRVRPEIAGNLTSATVPIPASKKGIPGETLEWRVTGTFEGSYKTRIAEVAVV